MPIRPEAVAILEFVQIMLYFDTYTANYRFLDYWAVFFVSKFKNSANDFLSLWLLTSSGLINTAIEVSSARLEIRTPKLDVKPQNGHDSLFRAAFSHASRYGFSYQHNKKL